ncbi:MULTISPECIES: hypothetical protein [Vibrio]|uniref:hypothetical protein n=1 Tax=Vibrio TaxID=662 RepID=UPI00064B2C75|nr:MULTISPECIES: hypothetical protein [Vibrio]EII2401656.1 hypothetical protein [Vibrio parahaemolyticus]EJG1473120.1 hypothetical protein [Vibrio parahaemolyticus]EKA7405792.1 hypothetical protein [Vibrio parahaemolyticus]EKG9657747.1 hypothetical protein [Vibrio parahaemolyticus]EKL9847732.1 hypothetical protein [Vibrio parahaemolyticus]
MKVFILGAVPPPLGGVSVYVFRRFNELKNKKGNVKLFDSRLKISFIYLLANALAYIVLGKDFEIEVNVSNKHVLKIITMLGLSKYCVFIDHNGYRRLINESEGESILFDFLKSIKMIKPVNRDIADFYLSRGISKDKIEIITPYIKPTNSELYEAERQLPSELSYLLNAKSRNIVLTSAWKTISSDDEFDLYGLLDILSFYDALACDFPDYYFVMMLGEFTDDDYGTRVLDKIKMLKQKHRNFVFINNGISQLSLLNKTAILLRLTKTDGDSVSIKEAIDFGAKVITTDVCPRPSEVFLFKVDDTTGINEKIRKILMLREDN